MCSRLISRGFDAELVFVASTNFSPVTLRRAIGCGVHRSPGYWTERYVLLFGSA
jgi:hypothetical protein